MFWIIGSQTLLQRLVADAYRGRVFGAYDTTSAILAVSGLTLGTTLGDAVGVIPVLDGANALYLLAGVLTLLLLKTVPLKAHADTPSSARVGELAQEKQ